MRAFTADDPADPKTAIGPMVSQKQHEGVQSYIRKGLEEGVVYMDAKNPKPSQEVHSREALAPVFAGLNKCEAITQFVGQSTICTFTGDRATGKRTAWRITSRSTAESGV